MTLINHIFRVFFFFFFFFFLSSSSRGKVLQHSSSSSCCFLAINLSSTPTHNSSTRRESKRCCCWCSGPIYNPTSSSSNIRRSRSRNLQQFSIKQRFLLRLTLRPSKLIHQYAPSIKTPLEPIKRTMSTMYARWESVVPPLLLLLISIDISTSTNPKHTLPKIPNLPPHSTSTRPK